MRQYRNKKSGTIISIKGELKGQNWELVSPAPEAPAAEKPKPKRTRRKKVADNG